uniref:3-isopropylmalate dehydrogenase n=1 Tax=Streptomyces althioticus TaxID=83380 RepID=UPI0036DAAE28
MRADIVVLEGDGIGPEVTAAAVQVLQAVATRYRHQFQLHRHLIGGAAIDATGEPLPAATLQACQRADAVLLGAVGGPKWSDPKAKVRPEQGLLALRKGLGLYANLRPVQPHAATLGASPIKPHLLAGVDLIVVRELTGGIYFGDKQRSDTSASGRRSHVVSVDKANVLETSRLWREVASRVAREEFPDVTLEHQLVDSMAMHLIAKPRAFDVIVTENMFGDILTDEASMLAGSLGLLPSASLGEGKVGLYEPIHGSAPDIAGRGIANPCGTILSAALLLRHSLGLEAEAACIEQAVAAVLDAGVLTADLAPAGEAASTAEVTAAVLAQLDLPCHVAELRD